jgi:hypothetical protein
MVHHGIMRHGERAVAEAEEAASRHIDALD